MRREPVEPWASAMRKLGFVYGGRPSFSRLASEARKHSDAQGPTTQTVIDVVLGNVHEPSDTTLNAIAAALHVPADVVSEWANVSREISAPYVPPDGSDRLTRRQRDAVDHLIRVMVEADAPADEPARKPRASSARAGKARAERAPHLQRIDGQGQDQP